MSQEDTTTQEKAPEAEPATEPSTEAKVEGTNSTSKVFDAAYVAELRKEAAKHRVETQEVKAKLAEREEADQSDLEKAQTKLAKFEKEAADSKAALLKQQIANEKGVPADAVEFLNGSSREELEASADKILSLVAKPEEAKPDFDGGAREPADSPESPEQEHNKTVLSALGLL